MTSFVTSFVRSFRRPFARVAAPAAGLLVLVACSGDQQIATDSAGASAAAANPRAETVPPAVAKAAESNAVTVSKADFAQVRWIAGDWIGRQPSGVPFYERYEIASDTLILTQTFADSTFGIPSENGQIVLSGDGRVTSGPPGMRWVATQWSPKKVHFEPLEGASNGFAWETISADRWKATIVYHEPQGDRTVSYEMRRRSAPK
jgi:hypothetical protein